MRLAAFMEANNKIELYVQNARYSTLIYPVNQQTEAHSDSLPLASLAFRNK
jgi:hypothetical protein